MNPIYLNDYHRERSKQLKERLSKQPKASLADAMKQYEQIRQGSSRQKSARPTAGQAISQ